MTANTMHHQPATRGKDVAKFTFDRDLVRKTTQPEPQVYVGISADAVESPAVRETEASGGAIADRQTEARITAVLGNVDAIKTRARNVYVSVTDGVVTLYGAVRDSGAAREIEAAIRTSAAIDAVQNNIHMIGAGVSD